MTRLTDNYVAQMMSQRSSKPQKPKTFQKGAGAFMWRSARGNAISMRRMSVEHLNNALSLCERSGNTGKAADLRIVLEARLKGGT